MNRPEIYQRSVDVLLDAYNEGKLEHGNCAACACGNLIAAACGYEVIDRKDFWIDSGDRINRKMLWKDKDYEGGANKWLKLLRNYYEISPQEEKEAEQEILLTGYSLKEFSEIELAFERSHFTLEDYNTKDAMFTGLTNVLNILKDIHSTELEESTRNQEKLENIYQNKLQTA